ncbi:MAG: YceI family protein [Wenzhouxiangella sp.]
MAKGLTTIATTIAIRIAAIALALTVTLSANAGDCYTADAESGELRFSGDVEGNAFQGHFRQFDVSLCMVGDDPSTAEIRVSVATASATVGNRQGDEALKEDELFAVDRFPEAVWTSTELVAANDGWRAEGELDLRGMTASQPVELQLAGEDDGFRLTGTAEILRLDYQVGIGEFEDTDFIRNQISLTFDLILKPESL